MLLYVHKLWWNRAEGEFMNKLHIGVLLSIPVLAAAVASTSVDKAYAATASTCTVAAVGTANTAGAANSKFTVENSTVSTKVKVTGDANCQQTVSLVTWKSPNNTNGRPYNVQTVVDKVTKVVGPGTYTLTSKIPDCYFQADIVPGTKVLPTNGADYGADHMGLLGYMWGGTQTCVDKPVTPVTPTTPETPATPVQPAAPVAAPAELPNTGPGAIFGLAATVSIVSGALYSIRQRLALR
jgi:hypothetical protein